YYGVSFEDRKFSGTVDAVVRGTSDCSARIVSMRKLTENLLAMRRRAVLASSSVKNVPRRHSTHLWIFSPLQRRCDLRRPSRRGIAVDTCDGPGCVIPLIGGGIGSSVDVLAATLCPLLPRRSGVQRAGTAAPRIDRRSIVSSPTTALP